jgi:hypothetical protein
MLVNDSSTRLPAKKRCDPVPTRGYQYVAATRLNELDPHIEVYFNGSYEGRFTLRSLRKAGYVGLAR